MRKKISDDRLDQLLTEYCEADGQQSFTFHPDEKREKIIPFARINRTALAAASLVLVSVLSLTVYFFFGNKNRTPVPVASSPQSVTTPSTPTGESGDPLGQQTPSAPTEPRSGLQQIMDWLFPKPTTATGMPTSSTAPTEKNTKSIVLSSKETTKSDTTHKPTEMGAFVPTESAPRSTEPPHPTEPCDPPSNDPTEHVPDPWEPTEGDPNEGDSPAHEPEIVPPTEDGGMEAAPPTEINASFDASLTDDVTHVYCKVYDDSGRRLGSSDLYDRSHRADVLDAGSRYASVVYEVPDGVLTRPGYYNYVFYDRNGRMLAQVQGYWD